jgi:hypothetical protein
MYIPIEEVFGCQHGYRNDNQRSHNLVEKMVPDEDQPEPRRVTLHFSSLPTYEVAAEFYSYIAFPDPLEEPQRKKYSVALSRGQSLR